MVEGPFGNLQVIQDILNGHLLVASGVDQPQGCIEDFVAPYGIFLFVEDPRQGTCLLSKVLALLLNRPTDGLFNKEYIPDGVGCQEREPEVETSG